jgi:hypothetical protein
MAVTTVNYTCVHVQGSIASATPFNSKVIRSVTSPELPGAVLLKLCLASRPENVFKNEFQVCSGFSIREQCSRLPRRGLGNPLVLRSGALTSYSYLGGAFVIDLKEGDVLRSSKLSTFTLV